MPLCALAVHQLRYYLAYGAHGSARLAHDGHAYLSAAEPIVLFAAALAVGAFVGRLARAWQVAASGGPTGAARLSPLRIWAVCALVLIAFYCGQELFEGAVFAAHPAGMAGVIGHGGWIALPLAAAIAGLLAALLRVGEALVSLAGRLGTRRRAGRAFTRSHIPRLHRGGGRDWRLHPAAGVSAGRAPPHSLLSA
jgi:hypothetical protein